MYLDDLNPGDRIDVRIRGTYGGFCGTYVGIHRQPTGVWQIVFKTVRGEIRRIDMACVSAIKDLTEWSK